MSEEIKIDGIPIQDYGTLNSRSCYPEEINIGETIKNNIDYWKNLYFEEKEKNKKLKIRCKELIEEKQELNTALLYDNIRKDKIRAKIEEIKAKKDFPEFADYEWSDTEKILFHQADILDDLLQED